MRQKYNTFTKSKINRPVIDLALKLKKQLPPGTKEVKLQNTDSNLVPTRNDALFYEWLCAKYLHLNLEDGLPLLKKAYKQIHNIDDTFKLCRYCGKPFEFTRQTKEYCSSKCRKRFERWGPKQGCGVTVSPISLDRDDSKYGVLSVSPHPKRLSVTKKELRR